ncbi:hypothetical protein WICPIJ_000344 [Wickerhamomyces pijperi]|uniref:Ribonuclease H2 subunit B n=1 Tax=Wickerhamomyces pijperi TaxID=599730 RepID=A0A9P8TQX1_WICPI|nr:hypothetical protein WICPIJ_000344 [Wickerhamomyces pijperi]
MTVSTLNTQQTHLAYLPTSDLNKLTHLKFPHPRTNSPTQFILHEDQLYEVKIIDNDNPHNPQNHLRDTTKGDDLVLRSVVFTANKDSPDQSSEAGSNGFILEDGSIYLTTKFNFSYVLINTFTQQLLKSESSSSRYQSLEDITESLSSLLEDKYDISKLPEALIASSLVSITENIKEGDDIYYRHSSTAILSYLKAKVNALASSFPESILQRLIKPKLQPLDIDSEIPEDILTLSKNKYSILLLSSYLNLHWTDKLTSSFDFSPLDKYISELDQAKKLKKLAEEQLQDVNALNASNRRETVKSGAANGKKVTKKAPVKKAPVGRGPLDSFFSKKK